MFCLTGPSEIQVECKRGITCILLSHVSQVTLQVRLCVLHNHLATLRNICCHTWARSYITHNSDCVKIKSYRVTFSLIQEHETIYKLLKVYMN